MKKKIVTFLAIITIGICGWLIINRMNMLDIPSNKNETYASMEKQKIEKRTDIDACEKNRLKAVIDFERKSKKEQSNLAFQTQVIAFVILVIQLALLMILFMMPKKNSEISQ